MADESVRRTGRARIKGARKDDGKNDRAPGRHGWFDLTTTAVLAPAVICPTFNAAMPPTEAAGCLGDAGRPIGIWFDRFSDGRGFTLARHLREAGRHAGPLLADGHLIPDQADYLRRCGFSHVRIASDQAPQWRRSLALAPPAMQQVLDSRRERERRNPVDRE